MGLSDFISYNAHAKFEVAQPHIHNLSLRP